MSAISLVWTRGTASDPQVLQRSMASAQHAYGNYRTFSWGDRQVALGGGLSFSLPEDRFDEQPLWSSDRSFCIVSDLRLDNRSELARDLAVQQPETLADSAFLLAAWLRWGTSCVDHLIGAFAFAIWLPREQRVFAARDQTGERPLFYHRCEDRFALASMPKGLLALPGVSRDFDEERIPAWLACVGTSRNRTFFKDIQRLPPGHRLLVSWDGVKCERYWHPGQAAPIRYRRDEEYAEDLRERFDLAIQARLRTNQRIGAHLSAGLDSGSVTASAARLLGAEGKGLTAFTAVPRPDFNGKRKPWQIVDEGPAAAEVARMYPNVEHVLVDQAGMDLLATMKMWTDAMDEPAINVVNILWITAILQQAGGRGIGVMLEGASGNGSISFETYGVLRKYFRRAQWFKLARTIRSLRRHGDTSLRAAARVSLGGLLPKRVSRALIPGDPERHAYSPLLPPRMMDQYRAKEGIFYDVFEEFQEPRNEMMSLFELTDLGPIHAATQAITGIEPRDPTADKRILEFCMAIPPEQYLVGGHSRSLVRRAMRGRLPESTLFRYKRGQQGADWYLPMSESLDEMRQEAAAIERCDAANRVLDLPRLNQLLDTWPTSGFEEKQVNAQWHLALSRAISLGYFLRTHTTCLPPGSD